MFRDKSEQGQITMISEQRKPETLASETRDILARIAIGSIDPLEGILAYSDAITIARSMFDSDVEFGLWMVSVVSPCLLQDIRDLNREEGVFE